MRRLLKIALLAFVLTFSAQAIAGNYTATRYPIVLVHGLFGFDSIAGVDYFFNIPDTLSDGGAQVFVASVPASNSAEVRGERLLAQVQDILATSGAAKVNLIGHSQGGFTVRYVASVRPDLVASLTSVGTPHKGSAVADLIDQLRTTVPPVEGPLAAVVNAFSTLIAVVSGHPSDPQDSLAALNLLDSQGAADFNSHYATDALPSDCGNGAAVVQGIHYYSWGGVQHGPTNVLDPSAAPLSALGLVFDEPNDGLVGQCSSHLGQVIRDDYRMDHLDEVNQLFGLVSPFATSPVSLFRQQANRLKNAGL